jgi:hypothetical protein
VVVAELEDRFTALACRIDAGCSEADARKAFHNLHRDVQATQGEFTSAGLPLALRAAENNLRAKSLQGLGNFLAKAWPQQSDVARASYQQALAATAISAAKVESEQQIAAIRRNALETSIASGGAKATAKAAGNRGGRYDGGRFGVECAKIIQIGEVWVTGLDANDIQSAAPGSTPQDVEAVLTDLRARIAGEKPRRGWVAKAEPSIESIIGRAKKMLVARRLYDDRGPPEQHAGGEAGRLGEHVFATDFAVVTQSTLERWRAGYPEGINEKWGYDIGGSAFTAFRNAATALDAAERYGRGLQKDVEAATEAAIAKTQREHDSEEIARLRDKDRDSLNAAWLKAGRPPFQSFEVQWREARRSAESAA